MYAHISQNCSQQFNISPSMPNVDYAELNIQLKPEETKMSIYNAGEVIIQ